MDELISLFRLVFQTVKLKYRNQHINWYWMYGRTMLVTEHRKYNFTITVRKKNFVWYFKILRYSYLSTSQLYFHNRCDNRGAIYYIYNSNLYLKIESLFSKNSSLVYVKNELASKNMISEHLINKHNKSHFKTTIF